MYDQFGVNFFIRYEVRVKFHSFACVSSVVSAPFVEKIILSPLNSLGTLSNSADRRHMVLFLNSKFYSIDQYVYPYDSNIFIFVAL